MVLAKERRCYLSVEQAAVLADTAVAAERAAVLANLALANEKDTAVCARNGIASDAPALAKEKQRQEEAAAQQCRAEDKRVTVPVMPPDPVDAAIWHIWAECTLHSAPLDAILAKIARNKIVHNVPSLPTTTLPPPMAMLSTSTCPTSYVGVVLSTIRGNPHAMHQKCKAR
jgi:hypothetical protein